MVFRGKSSLACANCRKRKTKCDLTVPECSPCLRLGQLCPGYRDPLDLLFCDESKTIAIKVQNLARRKLDDDSDVSESKEESCTSTDHITRVASNGYILPAEHSIYSLNSAHQLDDCATVYFFSNYVLSCEGTSGHLAYLHTLRAIGFTTPALTTAVIAVGTAALARATSSQELRVKSKQKYCSALSLANVALRDPVIAAQDETMAAVLLLGLYEVVTCTSQQSLESWYRHVNGALALVQLRGEQQFESKLGLQLFLHLRTQIKTMTCVQRGERVPQLLREFDEQANPFKTESQSYICRLGDIAANLCDVRAVILSKAKTDNLKLLATCMDIDNDLKAWARDILTRAEFRIEYLESNSKDALEGRCHTYKSLWSAWVWNCYRSVNIITHQTIVGFIRPLVLNSRSQGETIFTAQYYKSTTELRQEASDIFASVPFHLGTHEGSRSSSPAIGGLLIIWALYIAVRVDASTSKGWAIGRLQHIGQAMGIQQASALAEILQKGERINGKAATSIADCKTDYEDAFEGTLMKGPRSKFTADLSNVYLPKVKICYITDLPLEPIDTI